MIYEDVIIKDFIDCWFNKNYKVIPLEFFEICYNEYVDTSGLFATEDFDKIGYIEYLKNRIDTVSVALSLHKKFIIDFNVPLEQEFSILKEYGYSLSWNEDIEDFLNQIKFIQDCEESQISDLENSIKELKESRDSKPKEISSLKQSRISFISMIHSLCKIGYKIDMDKTTVEELAIIVKKQTEENNRA